jgi:hypothetical protein
MSARFLKELIMATLVSSGILLISAVILATALLLLVFGFPGRGDWIVDREQIISSPAGSKHARVTSEHFEPYLGGAPLRERVWIGGDDNANSVDIMVFVTNRIDDIVVAWTSDNCLQITLTNIQTVNKNLPEANGVTVVYHLADKLLKSKFQQFLDDLQNDRENQIRARFATDKNQERVARILKLDREQIETVWKNFLAFNAWALANADNADR